MAGMGVLTGMFVVFAATKDLDYKISFGIAGGLCFLIAVFIFFTVKDVRINKKVEDHLTLKYIITLNLPIESESSIRLPVDGPR